MVTVATWRGHRPRQRETRLWDDLQQRRRCWDSYWRIGRIVAKLNDFKITGYQITKSWIEFTVVPTSIMGPGDIHVRTIVGDNQTVFLHGAEDFLNIGVAGAGRDIDSRLQTKPGAHWQSTRRRAGTMRRWIDIAVC